MKKKHPRRRSKNVGFTLIELAIAIAVIGVTAGVASLAYTNMVEATAASGVGSAQASLQTVMNQVVERCHQNLDPGALPVGVPAGCHINLTANTMPANLGTMVVTAMRLPGGYTMTYLGAGSFRLNINSTSNFAATYQVTNNGQVRLTALTNFPKHTIDATGHIQES